MPTTSPISLNRKYRARGVLLTAIGLLTNPAQAGINDRLHFKVAPVIILWAANEDTGAASVVTDFIVGGGSGSLDLIKVDGGTIGVQTGVFVPSYDPSSTAYVGTSLEIEASNIIPFDTSNPTAFGAFEIDDNTNVISTDQLRISSDFYIATNTPFNISAQATEILSSGDFDMTDIEFRFFVTTTGGSGATSYGQQARPPGGTKFHRVNLTELTGVDVLQSDRNTALFPGSIREQSVRFSTVYRLDGGDDYDLSQGTGEVQAEVIYTAYVP